MITYQLFILIKTAFDFVVDWNKICGSRRFTDPNMRELIHFLNLTALLRLSGLTIFAICKTLSNACTVYSDN